VDKSSPRTSHVTGQVDARTLGFELVGAWIASPQANNFKSSLILFRQFQNRNYFLVSFSLFYNFRAKIKVKCDGFLGITS
jgi:hypothetical protein